MAESQDSTKQQSSSELFQMAENPWLVESVHSFLYLKCPECVFDTKYENEGMFKYHALENHPWSDVLFGNLIQVNPTTIENQILDSIKVENHDNFEELNQSYSSDTAHENSFSHPMSEMKDNCFQSYQVSEVKNEFPYVNIEEESTKNHSEQDNTQKEDNFKNIKVNGDWENAYEKGKNHQCHICTARFSTLDSVKRHIKRDHEDNSVEKPFPCDMCNAKYLFARSLKKHKMAAHEKDSDSLTSERVKNITEKVKITCRNCKRTFMMKSIVPHILQTENCKKTYSEEQLNNLRNSSKELSYLKTKEKRTECYQRKKAQIASNHKIKKILNVSSYMERYNDRLVQSELPAIDIKEEIGTDPIDQNKCFDCNKTFSNKEQLKRHMKYHKQSDRQFSCSECDKTFTMKHELLGHISSNHAGIPLVKCPICNKRFTTVQSMKAHVRIVHEGIKAHKCPKCDFICGARPNLMKHIQVRHTKIRVPCELCHQTFTDKSYLKTHYTLVHEENKPEFACEICKRTFSTTSSRARHVMNVCSKKETILPD